MRVVIQRVSEASVSVNNDIISSIGIGLLILVGIEESDNEEDSSWLANKISALRIFSDEKGVMNRSVVDLNAEIIVISQFTLHAKTKKGNRPSYIKAAKSKIAVPIYKQFINDLFIATGKNIQSGSFGDNMQIAMINDGPVTIIIDSKNKE